MQLDELKSQRDLAIKIIEAIQRDDSALKKDISPEEILDSIIERWDKYFAPKFYSITRGPSEHNSAEPDNPLKPVRPIYEVPEGEIFATLDIRSPSGGEYATYMFKEGKDGLKLRDKEVHSEQFF